MCTVSVKVNEDMLRTVLPGLDDKASISNWAQMIIDARLSELVAEEEEFMNLETARKFNHDMTVEELYNVIAEDIDSIYAED